MAHSAGSLPAEDTKWWVVCQRARYSVRTKFGTRAGVLSDRVDYAPSAVGADSFDVAIATEVIEHLVRPHNLPGFAKQLLRPGGHLIISTPYHGYLKNPFIALSNKWDSHLSPPWDGGHIKLWSRKVSASFASTERLECLSYERA